MSLPAHIAIIPDGNRRWAKAKGLPTFMGHRAGAKTTEKILTAALEAGIKNLTFWGASINNVTKRDNKEVQFLFKIFTAYFKKIAKAKLVHQNKVHINAFGEWEDYFPSETKAALKTALDATKNYHNFELTFLLAYNGTAEMVRAIQNIAAIKPAPSEITEKSIKQHLYTKNLPPVDLIIRTGNDPHLSTGFMMWDAAEAELFFSPKMYPDFSPLDLEKALQFYAQTERRLGK
ncbi:MAG: di-trans,poly-cis-decaprenylcistransferase [Candidatus Magasanikbacteria bacterium]|nr:di-trans,poly-cis-decaprenylcistransferase [Candidatus Magasanikbacteria bacterium]